MKIDRIYISHCEKLTERLFYINKIIKTDFFKEKTEVFKFSELDDQNSLKNNGYVYNQLWPQGLKPTEIFIAEQMFSIYNKVVENKLQNVLILEDDFIINDNFEKKINTIIENVPKDYDCVFMSSCGNLLVPDSCGDLFFESDSSRCTCAYLVSLNFCEKVIKNKKYFSPIDWHLNFIKKDLNLKYYWTKDILFVQGSENKYKSNIR